MFIGCIARRFWITEVEIPDVFDNARTLISCSAIASKSNSDKRKFAYSFSKAFFCFGTDMILSNVDFAFFIIFSLSDSTVITLHKKYRFLFFVFRKLL